MQVVDAHHHLRDLGVRDQDWITGPARLMFGSEWPVCTLATSYPDVIAAARDLTAELSPAEREAVFSGTATAIYGL
jgi:L-fuconolactonase